MALLKWSPLISEARGKLNGIVLARNQYGAYAREKVTPENPETTRQEEVRAFLTSASQSWRDLDDTQRAQWQKAAGEHSRRNVFGDLAPLNGFNHYVKINATLLNAGVSPLEVPGPEEPTEQIQHLEVGQFQMEDQLLLTVSPSEVPSTYAAQIEATPGLSPGRSSPGTRYRVLTYLTEGQNLEQNLNNPWKELYGNLEVNKRIFFRVSFIHTTNGHTSVKISCNGLVLPA